MKSVSKPTQRNDFFFFLCFQIILLVIPDFYRAISGCVCFIFLILFEIFIRILSNQAFIFLITLGIVYLTPKLAFG